MQFVLISEKHKMTMLGKRLGKTFNNKTKGNSEKTEMVQLDLLTENRAADIQQKPIKGFHTAEEMQDSILDLCRSLSRKTSEGEFDCKIWVEKLETYLSNSADRLMYSSISNHIFNKTEQELGTFGTNLDFVLHYVERKVEDNPASEYWKKSFKNVLKFYDHSNLAIQQQKLVSKKRMDLEHEVESILAPKIFEITKEMTQQLVGLIGIFTALSFIVFGGISSLDSIFGAVQETLNERQSVLPVLILADAWAFCMMNLLFGFMYFVIRITTLKKPAAEKAANIIQRYPVVFLCNYIILALLVLFSGMWFAEVNAVGKSVFEFFVDSKHSTWTFWIFVVLFIVFFGVLGWFLWKWYGSKKSSEK